MKQIEIRYATDADAVSLSKLIQRTILASNSKDYSHESLDLLCSIYGPEQVAERIKNEHILLCFEGVNPIGAAGLRGDYLRSVFVEPFHQGQGLGKLLVGEIEEIARQKSVSCLMVHSSITARRFYRALGFNVVKYQSSPEGPTILMSKSLS